MPTNDNMPAGGGHTGDDEWDDFVARFARETAAAAAPAAASAPGGKRLWPWAAGASVVAAAVAAFLVLRPAGSSPAGVVATAVPSASASAPSPAAPTARPAAVRAMVPLAEAFPAHVGSGAGMFTRVAAVTMKSCTEPDSVGPRLIGMIDESEGCVGEEVALYKDAHDDQFNLAVFTMKAPQDTVRLVTELSMAFDDYEVGAQAPPPGSGLPTLPADSGMVQAFTGQQRAMVAGLAQWSDGRTEDYQKLVDRLEPLLTAVSGNVARYEAAR
ncbi:hypothetical protein [Streptomyces sp. NPDC020983]|uniref:hypothetical protein n=1 Tax=Streptomyces sp. NPDC020983 TaxID=3365106 RepID=UPI0037A0C699